MLNGNKLKMFRDQDGRSQEQLGYDVGQDQSLISKIESGKIKNPSFCLVVKIAYQLKINLEDLVDVEKLKSTI